MCENCARLRADARPTPLQLQASVRLSDCPSADAMHALFLPISSGRGPGGREGGGGGGGIRRLEVNQRLKRPASCPFDWMLLLLPVRPSASVRLRPPEAKNQRRPSVALLLSPLPLLLHPRPRPDDPQPLAGWLDDGQLFAVAAGHTILDGRAVGRSRSCLSIRNNYNSQVPPDRSDGPSATQSQGRERIRRINICWL